MAYPRPPEARLEWDKYPPGFFTGVSIYQEIEGEEYVWTIPHNGLVTQALAADLLGVSTMAVNNWVRSGWMRDVKVAGQPSVIPLSEVKTFLRLLEDGGGRLPPGMF